MPTDLEKQLRQSPLFAKLRRDNHKAIAEVVKRERYPAGSVVCCQGRFTVYDPLRRLLPPEAQPPSFAPTGVLDVRASDCAF